ncbi:retrovirus-related pol polyprotein from transposon TNT 1-94 [Tanacetum coccineum]
MGCNWFRNGYTARMWTRMVLLFSSVNGAICFRLRVTSIRKLKKRMRKPHAFERWATEALHRHANGLVQRRQALDISSCGGPYIMRDYHGIGEGTQEDLLLVSLGLNALDMERGFLSQKASGVGRGVKEKQVLSADNSGEGRKHVDQEVGTKSATSIPIIETAGLGSYPTLSEVHGHYPACVNEGDTNAVGIVNTLVGNRVDVVVPMESIRAISEQVDNMAYGFFLGKRVAYPIIANYFISMDGLDAMLENGPWFIRNSSLILKKWNPYVNLLKEDVGNVPVWVKFHGVHVTAFSEDGLSAIATKLELKDHIVVAMPKLNQSTTSGTSTPNLASKKANSSRSLSRNVEFSSTSTTPMVEKINKIERLIIEGKVTLVDDEGKPLKKVVHSGDHDSEDEVAIN